MMAGNQREAKQTVNLMKAPNDEKNPRFICSHRSAPAVSERAFRDGVIHRLGKQPSDHTLIGQAAG